MRALFLAFQLAAVAQRPMSQRDSAALVDRLRTVEFQFMMDWRYSWQIEMRMVELEGRQHPPPATTISERFDLRSPTGLPCTYQNTTREDLDRREWAAHLITAPNRLKLSLCPVWSRSTWYEPPDERKSIDASLTPAGFSPVAADTARLMRRPVLALFDSAAKLLPGDGWVAGQRVRLHVDQTELGVAKKAASDCRAARWWCTALLGYVEFTSGDVSTASSTFDRARTVMPDSLRCGWDDASAFFDYEARRHYDGLSCAQRDSVNDRVWWLADPLWIENGNERRTEHYARHVLIDLHRGLDADERFDWRDDYQGPALAEMVMRYGWPTQILTFDSLPLRWHGGNTHAMFLGDTTITIAPNTWCGGIEPMEARIGATRMACAGPGANHAAVQDTVKPVACLDGEVLGKGVPPSYPCAYGYVVPGIKYWGPQIHTVPLWQTVADPFHATDAGWDLAPPRDGGPVWDASWWPLEFYRRDSGPLVPLSTQIAFFRRQNTPVLAVAMAWDTLTYMAQPAERMTAGVIVSTGPDRFVGARDTMSGRSPHPIVTTVASGPALLGVEMVPRGGPGAAARTRFGIDAPLPLRVLGTHELALSDIVLERAVEGEPAPTTMVAMLPRMLGSTTLRDPHRVALFWELYGLGTADTVQVALRIIHQSDPNALQRLGGLFGLTRPGADSVVAQWTEPRPDEPTATLEGGITIRPRGLVVDLTAQPAGRYTMEITVQRGAAPLVRTTRDFQIQR